MKKILFAAVSLPIVMASCTQDALENEMAPVNTPNAKGFQLELAPTLSDGNMTRGYDADKLNMWFEGDDQINMFWLGTSAPGLGVNYNQLFNSIFSIESNGTDGSNAFKSKSLVYAGYNVATFPGQYTTKAGNIVLTVENEPDGIENIPFISNLIDLNCLNNYQGNNQTTGNLQAGFNNKLSFPMKQAANYAELDINVSNIATDIEGYATDGIKINKITFISNANAFATSANVVTVDNTVKNNGQWKYGVNNSIVVTPIVAETKAIATSPTTELATTAISVVSNENSKATTTGKAYLMSFPTDAATTTGSIEIETNMGKVTIVSTVDPLDDTKNTTPLLKGTDNVTVESLFTALAKVNTASSKSKNFEGEVVGYAPLRTLNVDMKNAKINGSVVENSADILRYIALHKAIGSTENVTLVLSKKVGVVGVDFAGLTEAAVKALNDADKFKLDINSNSTIKLLGGGNVQNFMLKADKFVSAPTTYELAAAEWTAAEGLTTKFVTPANIINNGVLTISEVADKDFAVALTNNGTVKLADGATVVFGAEYTANVGSTTSVRASAIMKFIEDATINGNVTVNNDFIAAGTATVTFGKTAKVTNNDFISTNGENAKIINLGTITVAKDGTHTLITANEDAANKGTIVLNSRDNEVSVGEKDNMGYISIKSSQIGNAYEFAEGDKMNKIILDQDGKFTFKTNNKIAFVDVEANASIINGTGGASVVFAGIKVAEAKELTVSSGNVVRVKAALEEVAAWIGGKTRCEGTIIGDNAKIIVAGQFEYGSVNEPTGFYQAGAGVVKP